MKHMIQIAAFIFVGMLSLSAKDTTDYTGMTGVLEVTREIYQLAVVNIEGQPNWPKAKKEIVPWLDKLRTLDQLKIFVLLSNTIIMECGDEMNFEVYFSSAFWQAIERISLDKSKAAQEELLDIEKKTYLQGGLKLRFENYMRFQRGEDPK